MRLIKPSAKILEQQSGKVGMLKHIETCGRVCNICKSDKKTVNTDIGILCGKHYLQYKRHGKILERTVYDENEYEIVDDIIKIYLYNKLGEVVGHTLIDIVNLTAVDNKKWCLNTNGYVVSGYTKPFTYLHRLLMNVSDELVDHINGNILDNRMSNLRLCNTTENAQNKTRLNANNTSKVRGVHFDKSRNKWKVEIGVECKNKFIGRFDTFEIAVEKRLEAEELYYKNFKPIKNEIN